MAAPLLVHLVFHPASQQGRRIAVGLHKALNDDPLVPGLRIPTAILPEDGAHLPPGQYNLDEAQKNVVVVLADDDLALNTPVLEGRATWCEFIASLADKCGGSNRFVPFQLSPAAWPLHESLNKTNFARAYDEPKLKRADWVERRLVVEICRFLLGKAPGETAPVRVFLSHAVQDKSTNPMFNALAAYLTTSQPVEAWIDSGKIPTGSNFEIEIKKGIADSAVMVLRTESYSSRTYCRREVLMAKELGRPLIVVDGLTSFDARSFPYNGNAPTPAWRDGGAEHAVHLLLKEQLRRLHVEALLRGQSTPQTCVLSAPPELATIIKLGRGTDVLYPDPPLGDEELELLSPLGHRLQTPLQRAAADRVLTRKTIALSISESDAPERVGALPEHLDAALLEISRHLLVRGAKLAYGGHLGSDGYAQALFELVRAHRQLSGISDKERVINYVGWPLTVSREMEVKFLNLAEFVTVARPDGVEDLEPETFVAQPSFFPASSPQRRYAWARGMTHMRARQTRDVGARIVLGGKVGPTYTAMPDGGKKKSWYSGRIPGVIEETILSMRARQPVYICGAFGGAAAVVADLLQGKTSEQFTWDYQKDAPHAPEMRALYQERGDEWEDYDKLASFLRSTGVRGLSDINHLSEDENEELFHSRDVPRLIELLLIGLTR